MTDHDAAIENPATAFVNRWSDYCAMDADEHAELARSLNALIDEVTTEPCLDCGEWRRCDRPECWEGGPCVTCGDTGRVSSKLAGAIAAFDAVHDQMKAKKGARIYPMEVGCIVEQLRTAAVEELRGGE